MKILIFRYDVGFLKLDYNNTMELIEDLGSVKLFKADRSYYYDSKNKRLTYNKCPSQIYGQYKDHIIALVKEEYLGKVLEMTINELEDHIDKAINFNNKIFIEERKEKKRIKDEKQAKYLKEKQEKEDKERKELEIKYTNIKNSILSGEDIRVDWDDVVQIFKDKLPLRTRGAKTVYNVHFKDIRVQGARICGRGIDLSKLNTYIFN